MLRTLVRNTVRALPVLLLVPTASPQVGAPNAADVVRRLCTEVWTAGRIDLIDELVHEDYRCIGATPEDSPQSRAALKDSVRAWRASWKDVALSADEVVAAGNVVTLRWTFRGEYAGDDLPAAKGRTVRVPGTSVLTMRGAKIASERCSWDNLDLLRQLGAEATLDSRDSALANAERLVMDVYSRGDFAAMAELVTKDHVLHGPAVRGASVTRGPAEFEQRARAFRAAFPDLRFEIHELFAAGDRVVMRWTFRGTHEGAFLGVAPTKKQIAISGLILSRASGGKLAETWVEWDRNQLLEQLGAAPGR